MTILQDICAIMVDAVKLPPDTTNREQMTFYGSTVGGDVGALASTIIAKSKKPVAVTEDEVREAIEAAVRQQYARQGLAAPEALPAWVQKLIPIAMQIIALINELINSKEPAPAPAPEPAPAPYNPVG